MNTIFVLFSEKNTKHQEEREKKSYTAHTDFRFGNLPVQYLLRFFSAAASSSFVFSATFFCCSVHFLYVVRSLLRSHRHVRQNLTPKSDRKTRTSVFGICMYTKYSKPIFVFEKFIGGTHACPSRMYWFSVQFFFSVVVSFLFFALFHALFVRVFVCMEWWTLNPFLYMYDKPSTTARKSLGKTITVRFQYWTLFR